MLIQTTSSPAYEQIQLNCFIIAGKNSPRSAALSARPLSGVIHA